MFTAKATDEDGGSSWVVHYQLSDPHPQINVSLETCTVEIVSLLNREEIDEYIIAIEAFPPAELLLNVVVTDVYDNAPTFSQPSYSTVISSNLPEGSTVIVLDAPDADKGSNAMLTVMD